MRSFFQVALTLSLLAVAPPARSFVIIVSNRAGVIFPQALVADSSGAFLPANSLIRVAALNLPESCTPSGIATGSGVSTLWSYTNPFGSALRVGLDEILAHGIVEKELRQIIPTPAPSAWQGKSIFIYCFNAESSSLATEALLLEFPSASFAADFAPGLDAQVRLHLSEATVHVGSRQADGSLRTAALPAPDYSTWSTAAIGTTGAGALNDPDHDGICNLLEYAMGANPSLQDSPKCATVITKNPDQTVTFSWPQSSLITGITCVPYAGDSLGNFAPITAPITRSEPPDALAPGVQWCSVTVPIDGAHQFFVLKASSL